MTITMTMISQKSAPSYLMRPSRLFYFLDGDTILTCRNQSYRVHSSLLAGYSCVMREALSIGRLPKLWKAVEDSRKSKRSSVGATAGVEKRKPGGMGRSREIRYYISLEDNVQNVNLLFWCIYTCRGKPRITVDTVSSLLHLSTDYTIPTLLPLCITLLESLALFHPLQAIPTLRRLLNHRKTTPAGTELLQPLYSKALSTILNDLPRYQEKQREEYTAILPDELRAAFSDTWARYVERMNRLRSGEALFARFTYTHARQCGSEVLCEVETREQLRSSWKELWETCVRAAPRPCEVSRFFMMSVRSEGAGGSERKNDMCRAQVRQALGWVLRGFGGEDAAWDWKFLAVEEASLRMAKELAIRSRTSRGARIDLNL